MLENANNYPLNYLQFKSFVDKAISSKLADKIAAEYVTNIDRIANMMRKITI